MIAGSRRFQSRPLDLRRHGRWHADWGYRHSGERSRPRRSRLHPDRSRVGHRVRIGGWGRSMVEQGEDTASVDNHAESDRNKADAQDGKGSGRRVEPAPHIVENAGRTHKSLQRLP